MATIKIKYKNGNIIYYQAWRGTIDVKEDVLLFQDWYSNGISMIHRCNIMDYEIFNN